RGHRPASYHAPASIVGARKAAMSYLSAAASELEAGGEADADAGGAGVGEKAKRGRAVVVDAAEPVDVEEDGRLEVRAAAEGDLRAALEPAERGRAPGAAGLAAER